VTTLKTQVSCEVEDLISALQSHTGKPYGEIENALFVAGLYPEGRKTAISVVKRTTDYHAWIRDQIQEIMTLNKIEFLYITEAI
jgi:hypothetical protein